MNTQNDNSAVAEIADEYDEPELNDALLRVCAGYSLEEARTFFPASAGVLEDAWRELAEQYDVEPASGGDRDVHAQSLEYANPIDATLALALKEMHGPKLKDRRNRPKRYRAPTVLSLTWHEPIPGQDRTAEQGFLMIYEIGGGAGYLLEGQAGDEYWTVGVKAFEKLLIELFKPEYNWKIDYTTGEKIRTMLKTIGVYKQNLSPRFDEQFDVRDYPDDYEVSRRAERDWPARVFKAYE